MIIGFVGNLQSGKSSACKYVVGEALKKYKLIDKFSMTETGDLYLPTADGDSGVFNPENRSEEFRNWAAQNMWKYVKIFNFADSLKRDVVKYFNISEELVWGNKKDKDTLLSITWGDISKIYLPAYKMKKEEKLKRLTVRDLLIVHADWIRGVNKDAFVNACFYEMNLFNSTKIKVIGDVRYENEINKLKAIGGKVIRLKKIVEARSDSSERTHEFPDEWFDLNIDNQNMTMEEKNSLIKEALVSWEVL